MISFCFYCCFCFFSRKLMLLLSLELLSLWTFFFFFVYSSSSLSNYFCLVLLSVFLVLESVLLCSLLISSSRGSSWVGHLNVSF